MQLELTEQILKYIEQHEKADTLDLAVEFNEDHQKVVGALKSIQAHGDLLNSETTSRKAWQVTDEGQYVIENGSHEAFIFNAIPTTGISQPDLMKVCKSMERLRWIEVKLHHLHFRHRQTPKLGSARQCLQAGL